MQASGSHVEMSVLEASRPRFGDLPPDIVEKVFLRLSPREITSAAPVSKAWADAARSPALWAKFSERMALPAPAPAPAPAPRVVDLVRKWPEGVRTRDYWLGGILAVGQVIGGILLADLVGAPITQRREDACVRDYCATVPWSNPSQTCFDYWKDQFSNVDFSGSPADVRKCLMSYGLVASLGIAMGATGGLVGPAVALGVVVRRLRRASLAAANEQRQAWLRRTQEDNRADPVAKKRVVMRRWVEQEALLVDLRRAIWRYDDVGVRTVLARKPGFSENESVAILKDAIVCSNAYAVEALLDAGYPVTPACFKKAMCRGRTDIFKALRDVCERDEACDMRRWITKQAFAEGVQHNADASIVTLAIDALGPAAAEYINANVCERGASPFFMAAQSNHVEAFRVMLQNGGDLRSCVQERRISVEQMACQSRELESIIKEHVPSVRVRLG